MRRQLVPAVVCTLVFTALTGVVYPVVVWMIGRVAFPAKADGSLVHRGGEVVGSALIGQPFTGAAYFHPRPSAAGTGYDGMNSSASNLGPNNPKLVETVGAAAAAYRTENGLAADVEVPVDAVTTSASGLDPHISIANARLQAPRVAAARGMDVGAVLALVDRAIERRPLGVLGDDGVNVLLLNLSLDG